LALIAATTSPAFAGKSDDGAPKVVVNSAEAQNNVVMVEVQNMTKTDDTVKVMVEVMLDGKYPAMGYVPVYVQAGQKMTVPVGFLGTVTETQTVGIIEDSSPM
jgi:hypothetical protein